MNRGDGMNKRKPVVGVLGLGKGMPCGASCRVVAANTACTRISSGAGGGIGRPGWPASPLRTARASMGTSK
ncbi:MAG: hypothetical protein RLZZ631_746 [Cyanobacteriota bacterium]|jgi:hypothetical protein